MFPHMRLMCLTLPAVGASILTFLETPAFGSVLLDFDTHIYNNSAQNNTLGTSISENGFTITAPTDIWVYGSGAAAWSGDPALFNSTPNTAITIAASDQSAFDLHGFTLSEATVNLATIVLFEAVYANATTFAAAVSLDGNAAVPQAFTAGSDFNAAAFSNIVGLRFYQPNPGYQINSITMNATVPEPGTGVLCGLATILMISCRRLSRT